MGHGCAHTGVPNAEIKTATGGMIGQCCVLGAGCILSPQTSSRRQARPQIKKQRHKDLKLTCLPCG